MMRAVIGFVLFAGAAVGQEQAAPLDGPRQIFQDELLGRMAGKWRMTGTIRGQSAEQSVEADWVLNHQFLRIHEVGATDPKTGKPGYEAHIMVGYDSASERYVAHWMDVYGGRFSETLGYGVRSGEQIEFVFEYPDGPFRTVFRWSAEKREWQWLMRTKDAKGKWVDFAMLVLSRVVGAQ